MTQKKMKQKTNLPERAYYALSQTAEKINVHSKSSVDVEYLIRIATQGHIELCEMIASEEHLYRTPLVRYTLFQLQVLSNKRYRHPCNFLKLTFGASNSSEAISYK